ncbi:MAG: Stk1 family PASTA domain-containing Ser/Thr kinase, partial [Bacillota bacterium]
EYSSDQEFVERFQREAKSAAKLCHPNVVNIYDVGETENTHYIVMEYIDGVSLKDMIKKEGTLSIDVSLKIAQQICSALEHAHKNLIIHRDIKPHNIMITKDNHVKVMDFGIARAISSATITRTGVVLGSVHYFSPEQATGKEVTEASDIYSLGIVLYEMLTGKVPFEADTPVGIAYQHVQAKLPPLEEKRPDLPPFIVNIVNKALAKSAEDRFKSAHEMEIEIFEALNTLQEIDLEKTFMTKFNLQESFSKDGAMNVDSTMVFKKTKPYESNERDNKMSKKDADKTNQNAKRSLARTVVFILLGLALPTYLFIQISAFLNVPEVAIPDIIGLSDAKAREVLDEMNLVYEVESEIFDSNIPRGHVINQIPEAGRTVKVNRSIQVTLSKGPELVTVPDITTMDIREAQVRLQAMALNVGERDYVETDEYPPNTIIDQIPKPNEQIEKGDSISIQISKATSTRVFQMPNLINTTLSEAKILLARQGLILGDTFPDSHSFLPEGYIIAQNPLPESDVAEGTIVDVTISTKSNSSSPENAEPNAENLGQDMEFRGVKEYNVLVHVIRSGNLRIVVIDETGSKDWFHGDVKEGELIQRKVNGVGVQGKSDVYVQIWLDGEILREIVLQDVAR